ncbi:MAG: DUF262 domain-containing protein [Eubacteriaceae bacterium]|nr:DUF262 domain-containing protein [Eubacteriaceae bacterium]
MKPTKIETILCDIHKNKILLPYFQRDFVWDDKEMQCRLIASVLSKMPVGSILLVKAEKDEFKATSIGRKDPIQKEDINNECSYLLDGQQRLTVIANAFSNLIFAESENQPLKWNQLKSSSLKRRFFLEIPTWKSLINSTNKKTDFFNVERFEFPCFTDDGIDFLSNDIKDFIRTKDFNKKDEEPYVPGHDFDTNEMLKCCTKNEYYLIPLYIVCKYDGTSNNNLTKFTKGLKESYNFEVKDFFDNKRKQDQFENVIKNVLHQKELEQVNNSDDKLEKAKNILSEKIEQWIEDLKKFLIETACNAAIECIEVEKGKRERAIAIYENMNIGGVSLSAFDLIMAKVAVLEHDDDEGTYQRIVNYINSNKKHRIELLPDINTNVKKVLDNRGLVVNNFLNFNASQEMDVIKKNGNVLNKQYTDILLNVMSLYCYNHEMKPEKISLNYTKKKAILDLNAKEIKKNIIKVCEAMDRAFLFLFLRCGIQTINKINYKNIITVISFLMLDDKFYNNKKNHDYIEAWYWNAVFSGAYDRDQNQRMESDLKELRNSFLENNWDFLKNTNKVFNAQDFSDKKTLLMEGVVPKKVLRTLLSQFFLSETYSSFFSDDVISVFTDKLEEHHIIPLGSAKTINESSLELRKDEHNILNTPLNFIYITKSENKAILSKSIKEYSDSIVPTAYSKLQIQDYMINNSVEANDYKQCFEKRFKTVEGLVKGHINDLL